MPSSPSIIVRQEMRRRKALGNRNPKLEIHLEEEEKHENTEE